MRARRADQRGVALFTALLVVALAAVLLTMLFDTGEASYARSRNAVRFAQADQYALGLEAWAKDILLRDLSDDNTVDTREDIWAAPLLAIDVPGGRLHGVLRDLGGCFNLNDLADGGGPEELWGKRFRRLLRALKIDPELADAVADWIDADFEQRPRGGEDTLYLLADPGYRAANRRFAHISELRLVRGMTDEIYQRLAPHVCALPFSTPINVNTATAPVLMSLDEQMSASTAQRLMQDGHARYGSASAFTEAALKAGVAIADARELATTSEFFVAHAEITLDDVPIEYTSVIQRRPGVLAVIARMRGEVEW